MQRFTISLDEDLAHQFDAHMMRHGYATRSEAVRDLIRRELQNRRAADDSGQCVGCVCYVYAHHERNLAARLAQLQHDAHDLVVATMHVHLDHQDCMEVLFLRGDARAARTLAQGLVAERGVRHGMVHLLSLLAADDAHVHADDSGHAQPHRHAHLPT